MYVYIYYAYTSTYFFHVSLLHNYSYTCTSIFQFREEFFQVHTLESHYEHLAHLEDDESGVFSKEVGVNCRSKLLELEHFDLCSGALVPDVMHDLLERVLQHLLRLLRCYCIEEQGLFTLSYLNEKILGFGFGYMEDNRPSPVDKCNHLKQNGTLACVYMYMCMCAWMGVLYMHS